MNFSYALLLFLDSSPGATNAPISSLGISGYELILLVNYKIPVDGHLVAWQYYIGHKTRACESYVAIWRESGSTFTRIAETRLTPENPQNGGVRFQYVQNSTNIVHKDDFIAYYVGESTNCDGHLISARNRNPDDPPARIYNGVDRFTKPSSIPTALSSVQYTQKKGVALKAYIAG